MFKIKPVISLLFFAACGVFSSLVMASSAWQVVNANPFTTAPVLSSLLRFTADADIGEQYWLLGGDADTDIFVPFDKVWVSNDAINWSEKTQDSEAKLSPTAYHSSVVFNNRMWVLGGLGSFTSSLDTIASSADGVSWTYHTTLAKWSARFGHASVVFNNKMWVLGGQQDGVGYRSDVWSSEDGINWTQVATDAQTGWDEKAFFSSLVFDNKIWIMGGGVESDVWSSPDGANWTQVATNAQTPWSDRDGLEGVVYNGKMWIIGGVDPGSLDGKFKDVWSSTDGLTWVQEADFPVAVYYARAVVANNAIIVPSSVGSDDNTINKVYSYQEIASQAPTLTDDTPAQTFILGVTIEPIVIESVGSGLLTECSSTPLLPTGLMISVSADANGCAISGAPTEFKAAVDYTISATNVIGSDEVILSLSVVAGTGQPLWRIANENAFSPPRINNTLVQFGGNLFLLGGTNADSTFARTNAVLRSTNGGINWSNFAQTTSFDAVDVHSSVTYSNQIWIVAGRKPDNAFTNATFRSSNGAHWVKHSPASDGGNFIPRAQHTSVVFKDKVWHFGGIYNNNVQSTYLSTTDGVLHTIGSDTSIYKTNHNSVHFDNQVYLMGGLNASFNRTNDVWRSTNNISNNNWVKATASANWSPREKFGLVVYNNKIWLMGGNTSDNISSKEVWSSADGITWKRESDLPAPLGSVRVIVHNGKIIIASGVDLTLDTDHFYQKALDQIYTYDATDLITAPVLSGESVVISIIASATLDEDIVFSKTAGNAITACAANPPLPESLSLSVSADGNSCVVSGKAPGRVGNDTYVIHAANSVGFATTPLILNVEAGWIVANSSPFSSNSARGFNALVKFTPDGATTAQYYLLGGATSRQPLNVSNAVFSSDDAITWTGKSQTTPFAKAYSHSAEVFNDKIWILGGGGSSTIPDGKIWSSADATNWTEHDRPWDARVLHSSLIYDGKMWVIGGTNNAYDADGYKSDVWYTENGTNWTKATDSAQFGGRFAHTSVVFDNKMWVIGGYVHDQAKSDVWSSTNGETWSIVATDDETAWGNREDLDSAVYNGKIWIIGGGDNQSWSSANGINWTQEASLPNSIEVAQSVVVKGSIVVPSSAPAQNAINNKVYSYQGGDISAPIISSDKHFDHPENQAVVTTLSASNVGQTIVFSLSGTNNDNSSFTLMDNVLSFQTPPNFEVAGSSGNQYTVGILAVDVDDSSLVTAENITITVIDVNEAAVFTSGDFQANENNTTVGTVTATDDDGDGIKFSLPLDATTDNAVFTISENGMLRFAALPDYENPAANKSVYSIKIKAEDLSDATISSEQNISVTLNNINEAPYFTSANFTYAENKSNLIVGTILATDPEAQTLAYSISGADAGSFNIGANNGILSFNTKPNYETDSSIAGNNIYQLLISINDNQTPPLSASQNISITLIDVNDAPSFVGPFKIFSPENKTNVMTITATDEDGDAITFSISSAAANDNNLFTSSPAGLLSFKNPPNYENPISAYDDSNNYTVTIHIEDNQTPALTTDRDFSIVVTDVNEAPILTITEVQFDENFSDSKYLNRTDADSGQDSANFALTASSFGVDNDKFSLTNSGYLSFNSDNLPNYEEALDHDNNNVYSITVTLTDLLDNTLSAPFDLRVIVNDINDAPTISGIPLEAIINVPYSFTPTSNDEDNDALTFSISGTLPSGLTHNTNSGAITGSPSESGTFAIIMSVTDTNKTATFSFDLIVQSDNSAPIISQTTYNIAENQADVEILIDELSAVLSIIGGADANKFTPDGHTLRFNNVPNFESPAGSNGNVYTVRVRATDGQDATLKDEETLTIIINDINEAPIITSTAEFSVNENTTVVATIIATDEDGNQALAFSVSSQYGLDKDAFNINQTSGQLSFNVPPNFEQPTDILIYPNDDAKNNIYKIVVEVSDQQTSPLFVTQTISITVKDIDEPPLFTSMNTISMDENQTEVITLEVQNDVGQDTIFSITGGADMGLFNLDDDILSFKIEPNFESGDNNYTVIITAADSQNPSFASQQTLNITITDINDAPSISPTAFSLNENDTTAVFNLTASDEDAGQSAVVYTTLSGADADLFILTSDGALRFKIEPNYEFPQGGIDNNSNIYEVDVIAFDDSTDIKPGTTTIYISVYDVADDPNFTLNKTQINLIENAADTYRYQVEISGITDADGGATFAASSTDAIFSTDPAPVVSFFANDTVKTHATKTDAVLYFSIKNDTVGSGIINITLTDAEHDFITKAVAVTITSKPNSAPIITHEFDPSLENITIYGGHLYGALSVGSYDDIHNNFSPEGYLVRLDSRAEYEFVFNDVNSSVGSSPFIGLTNSGGSDGIWNYDGEQIALGLDTNTKPISDPAAGVAGVAYFPGYYVRFRPNDINPTNKECVILRDDFVSTDCNQSDFFANGGIFEFPAGLPAISSVTPFSLFEKSAETVVATLSGYDLDGDSLSWLVGNSNNGNVAHSIITDSGGISTIELRFKPNDNFIGSVNIALTLTDNKGGSMPFNITGAVNAIAPTIPITDFTLDENQTAVGNLTINTVIGKSAQFLTTLSGDDADKFILTTDGILSFKVLPDFENPADNNHDNTYHIIVSAIDTHTPPITIQQAITIIVTDLNEAPIISGAPAPKIAKNIVYTFIPTVITDAGETLDYSFVGSLPSGLIFDNTTGGISGAPTVNGTFEIVITVMDSANKSAQLAVTIKVVEALTFNLDIDNDSEVFASSDGILILRYMLLDSSATSVDTTDVLGATAQRNGTDIFSYLDEYEDFLDIDSDGNINVNVDGILIMRYMLNPTAATIQIDDVLSNNSSRNTSAAILIYLKNLD